MSEYKFPSLSRRPLGGALTAPGLIGSEPVLARAAKRLPSSLNATRMAPPHPDASAYAPKFKATYEHRQINGRIGNNLPQEAPETFSAAGAGAGSWA